MFTDRTALRTAAYAEHGPLAARLSIYDYQTDRVDLPGLAVGALAAVRGRVLDAGCGLGNYVGRLRSERPDLVVLPLDLSAGMRPEVVGDIQALPLADAAVDGALAMHMLYHVPDIPAAVCELRRVLRTGGVLLVSTNGIDDKLEIHALLSAALSDLTGRPEVWPPGDDRFTLEDGSVLRESFDDVRVHVFERDTFVPEAAPVLAFVDSFRGLSEAHLPDGVTWAVLMACVQTLVEQQIARAGAWRMHNQVGMFTCR